LTRLTQQDFSIQDAKKIDEITELDIIPLEAAFNHLESVKIPPDQLKSFINGSAVNIEPFKEGLLRAYNSSDEFIALGRNSAEGFKHEYLV
jgi:tRNA U55 pseudouridine synthase TruB